MILGSLVERALTNEENKINQKISAIFNKYTGRTSPYNKDINQIMKLRDDSGIIMSIGDSITKFDGKHKDEPMNNRLIAVTAYKREYDGKLQMDITVNPKKFAEKYAINPQQAIDETDRAVDKAFGKAIQRLKIEYKGKLR